MNPSASITPNPSLPAQVPNRPEVPIVVALTGLVTSKALRRRRSSHMECANQVQDTTTHEIGATRTDVTNQDSRRQEESPLPKLPRQFLASPRSHLSE